jgi:hypothetical protein
MFRLLPTSSSRDRLPCRTPGRPNVANGGALITTLWFPPVSANRPVPYNLFMAGSDSTKRLDRRASDDSAPQSCPSAAGTTICQPGRDRNVVFDISSSVVYSALMSNHVRCVTTKDRVANATIRACRRRIMREQRRYCALLPSLDRIAIAAAVVSHPNGAALASYGRTREAVSRTTRDASIGGMTEQ